MNKHNEVNAFLQAFKAKYNVWNVIFRDHRSKNVQTLLDLDITPLQREKVLKDLQSKDYSEGPLSDNLYKGPDMWVFGVWLKSNEIYIKITMGLPGAAVICISFHKAEYPMQYPLK